MDITTLEDLLIHQLRDLHSAETQIQRALDEWTQHAQSEALEDALADRLMRANRNITRIQQLANTLGAESSKARCAGMEGLITEGNEVLDQVDSGPVGDAALIAAARRIEQYSIAGYGTARLYAQQLGREQATQILQRRIDESNQLDDRLVQLAETITEPDASASDAS